jgi:hypothetical protein
MRNAPIRQVYFLRRSDDCGPIKIGCSAWPEERRRQVSYDMKLNLKLLAFAPGGFEIEAGLHRRFYAHRVEPEVTWNRDYPLPGAKEWFAAVPELLTLVAEIARTGSVPLAGAPLRNAEIVTRRLGGETLQAIARDFGLTRERVRQIVSEHFTGQRRSLAA